MANSIQVTYLHKNLFYVHTRERAGGRPRIAVHIRKIIIIFIYTQSNLTCNDNILCSFSIAHPPTLSLFSPFCVRRDRFAFNFVPYRTRMRWCTMLDIFFIMPLAFDFQDDFIVDFRIHVTPCGCLVHCFHRTFQFSPHTFASFHGIRFVYLCVVF